LKTFRSCDKQTSLL